MEELTKHTHSGQNIKQFFFLCLSAFTLLVYESVPCNPMGGAAMSVAVQTFMKTLLWLIKLRKTGVLAEEDSLSLMLSQTACADMQPKWVECILYSLGLLKYELKV